MIRAAVGALSFVLGNFGTPLAFFAVFQWRGARPAIAVAIAVALIQTLYTFARRRPFSPFFVVASAFTTLFGSLDFLVQDPHFFRFEPAAENFALFVLFTGTVLAGKPIMLWFAQAMPPRFRPELSSVSRAYLTNVTLAWMIYLLLKALLFLYLAFAVDLGRLILLRSVIGGTSIVMMVGGEMLYRKWMRPAPQGSDSSTA